MNTALDLFKDRRAWAAMMRNAMTQDFSWRHQAQEYVQLYVQLYERMIETL